MPGRDLLKFRRLIMSVFKKSVGQSIKEKGSMKGVSKLALFLLVISTTPAAGGVSSITLQAMEDKVVAGQHKDTFIDSVMAVENLREDAVIKITEEVMNSNYPATTIRRYTRSLTDIYLELVNSGPEQRPLLGQTIENFIKLFGFLETAAGIRSEGLDEEKIIELNGALKELKGLEDLVQQLQPLQKKPIQPQRQKEQEKQPQKQENQQSQQGSNQEDNESESRSSRSRSRSQERRNDKNSHKK
jgi:hypothetical protein